MTQQEFKQWVMQSVDDTVNMQFRDNDEDTLESWCEEFCEVLMDSAREQS